MWLKTTQPGTGQFWWEGSNILYGDVQGLTRNFGLSIGNGGKVLFGVDENSTSLTGSRAVNDGKWHHVVATHSGVTGAFAVYVDGELVGQNSKFAGPLDVSPTLFIGNLQPGVASFRGSLDFLTIYGSSLKADAVLDLYQGELPSDLGYTPNPTACVLGGASTTGFPWARIGLERKLARGAGPLTSSAGLNLTVDGDKPTTTIDLAEGQFFKAPANGSNETLIIGGSASDGSGVGVASVEVTANGGTGLANGTETWAHTIEIHEGVITVQSTAVDFLGNRGNQRANGDHLRRRHAARDLGQSAHRIFHTVPRRQRGLESAHQRQRERPHDWERSSGQRRNRCRSAAAIEPGRVVRLAGGSMSPIAQGAGRLQQTWSLDYEIADAVGDPTGSYTVTVRAADLVGNQSEKILGVVQLVTPDMQATIRSEDADLDPITRPGLAGTLTSVTGIGSVEAALVPIDQITGDVRHRHVAAAGRTGRFGLVRRRHRRASRCPLHLRTLPCRRSARPAWMARCASRMAGYWKYPTILNWLLSGRAASRSRPGSRRASEAETSWPRSAITASTCSGLTRTACSTSTCPIKTATTRR